VSSVTATNTTAYHSTAGALIVAVIRSQNGSVTSVTDTAGDTFVQAGSDSGSTVRTEIWYALNATGNSANVVTANWSASTSFTNVVVQEFEGVATSSALDATASGTSTTTTLVTGTYSTVEQYEVSVIAASQNGGYTFTSSGFNNVPQSTSSTKLLYRFLTATQSSITTTVTSSGGTDGSIALATFKGTANTGGGGGGETFTALWLAP
jgi:hypothetical protein